MIQAVPNSNFTVLDGRSIHESDDPRYLEYRRQWFENPQDFIVRDFPLHLDIEVTNRCNLNCTFCDKLPLLSKDQFGDMDFSLYKKIIDEGNKNGLCSVKLSYRGEPLLHPQLTEMILYAKKQGIIDLYFNTNGMLLTEKKVLSLMDAGLDRISVSVEGTDPKKFEMERRGASFNKILRNIERLMELREKKNLQHPKVRIQTVTLPNIDLDKYARFWATRCDEVAAIDYKEAKERKTDLIDNDWACPQLWQRMTVEWDGAIMPCNNDDHRTLSPGSAANKSVYESWHAPIVESARNFHERGESHMVRACNGCPWRTTQISKRLKE